MAFDTLDDFRALLAEMPGPDPDATEGAQARNGQLTKPPGALGRLEDLAIWYAGWRGDAAPVMDAPQIIVFAANHGVAAKGVSAFPPEVTAQMVGNFQAGGAAINQLARSCGARMRWTGSTGCCRNWRTRMYLCPRRSCSMTTRRLSARRSI